MAISDEAQRIREQVIACLQDELTVDVSCDHEQGAMDGNRVKVRVTIGIRSLNATIATSHDSFHLV